MVDYFLQDRCGCDSLLRVVSKVAKNLKVLKVGFPL